MESGVTISVFPGHGHPIWLQNKFSYCFDVRIMYFLHVGSVLGEARREVFSQCCSQGTCSLSSQCHEADGSFLRLWSWRLSKGAENCGPGMQGAWGAIVICSLTLWWTGCDCFIVDIMWREWGAWWHCLTSLPSFRQSSKYGFYPVTKLWQVFSPQNHVLTVLGGWEFHPTIFRHLDMRHLRRA